MNEYMRAAAQARVNEEAKRAELERLFLGLGHIPEYQAYLIALANLQEAKQQAAKAETQARWEAERVYRETGDKAPFPGAKVKTFVMARYDADQAREWAMSNAPTLLAFDRGTFDKAAKAGLLQGAPVELVAVPQVYLDKDLSVYLEPVTEAGFVDGLDGEYGPFGKD